MLNTQSKRSIVLVTFKKQPVAATCMKLHFDIKLICKKNWETHEWMEGKELTWGTQAAVGSFPHLPCLR